MELNFPVQVARLEVGSKVPLPIFEPLYGPLGSTITDSKFPAFTPTLPAGQVIVTSTTVGVSSLAGSPGMVTVFSKSWYAGVYPADGVEVAVGVGVGVGLGAAWAAIPPVRMRALAATAKDKRSPFMIMVQRLTNPDISARIKAWKRS